MGVAVRERTISSQGRTFRVAWNETPLADEWDTYLESAPDGHHEQTSLWGEVRARFGWKVGRLVLSEHGVIAGGAQLMVRPLGRFAKFGYVTYGPCFRSPDPLLEHIFLTELGNLVRHLGALFLVLGLPYGGHDLAPVLKHTGFHRKPATLPPHFLEATAVIDLKKSLEEIRSLMHPATRRNVRQSEKRGLVVLKGEEREVGTFFELMVKLCERRQISPNPPQREFFQELWRRFHPRGWAHLFIVMRELEPVAAAFAFSFGEWFRVWKVGWSGQHGNLKPNERAWWEAIQYAHKTGHRYFDFVEVDEAQAKDLLENKSSGQTPRNATSFKLGFGGELKILPGAYLYFPNALVRTALRVGAGRLLQAGWFTRRMARFDGKPRSD